MFQTGVVTTATAVALGGCLTVTTLFIHTASVTPDTSPALTYGIVGLIGELIVMLGLVSIF